MNKQKTVDSFFFSNIDDIVRSGNKGNKLVISFGKEIERREIYMKFVYLEEVAVFLKIF